MKFVIAILIVTFIFGFLNYYIGVRNLRFLKSLNIGINKALYWIVFGIISMSYIIARFSEGVLPYNVSGVVELIGGYWLAVMLYLIIILLIIDIFRITNKRFSIIKYSTHRGEKIVALTGILIFVALAAALAYGTWNAKHPVVKNYEINISKKAGNIKDLNIVMVSDLHLGLINHNSTLEGMVHKINSLNPDVVLIAGDIIDDNINPFIKENMADTLKKIKAPMGVYAVLGNHDYISNKSEELANQLKKAGVKLLQDKYIKVENSFYIIGRNDSSSERTGGDKREEMTSLLQGIDKSLPLILMDHQPYHLEEGEALGIDVQFSGHTHRGQIFPNEFITRRVYELDWGYLKKNSLNVFVSSGYGTWGPPIRLGNNAEIVNVKVHLR